VDDVVVVNLRDARARRHPRRASIIELEPDDGRWADTGINVRVMEPGQPSGRYHSEPNQEDFLVLYGECLAIVDEREQPLRQWDLLHCPADTPHVFVGAGEGPSAVLMIGSRQRQGTHYPLGDAAARHGASVSSPTDDPDEAYADWRREPWQPAGDVWPCG
jgi:uncharacterized cupin superfamily protein